MKVSYVCLVGVYLLTLVSYYSYELDEKVSIQQRIDYNYSYLTRRTYEIDNFEKSRSLAIEMSNGNCPVEIHQKYIPRILMMTVSDNFDLNKATNIYNCLSTHEFDNESYYDIMITAFSKFEKSENVKLMYLLLFKDYIPQDENLFTFIEFNMIRCEKSANLFLYNQNFPTDSREIMSKRDYIYFESLTRKWCD